MSDSAPSKEGLIFPLVPKPCPEESVSSWVIRLCGAYQCTFSRLQILSGISVHDSDWDCGLAQEFLDALLRACGYSYADFGYRRINPLFLKEIGFKLTPRYFQDKPAYAWCPTCFDEDPEPYLRWQWRFRNFTHCVKHRTLLETECQKCGAGYTTHRSLLLNRASVTPALLNLAHCQMCGVPLGPKSAYEYFRLFGRDLSSSQLLPNESSLEDIDFKFKFERLSRINDFGEVILFHPMVKHNEHLKGSGWRRYLTRRSRSLVAKALLIIRREKQQNRFMRDN